MSPTTAAVVNAAAALLLSFGAAWLSALSLGGHFFTTGAVVDFVVILLAVFTAVSLAVFVFAHARAGSARTIDLAAVGLALGAAAMARCRS